MNDSFFPAFRAINDKLNSIENNYHCDHSLLSDIVKELYERPDFLNQRSLMVLLESYCTYFDSDIDIERLKKIFTEHYGNALSRKLFKYWQWNYEKEKITDFCRCYTISKSECEWYLLWRKCITSNNQPKAFALFTSRENIPYYKALEKYEFPKESLISNNAEAYFYTFCSSEVFNKKTDDYILNLIRPLNLKQLYLFFNGMIKKYPLKSKSGKLQVSKIYTVDYHKTTSFLLNSLSEVYANDNTIILLNLIFEADKIKDIEHRNYWQYRFLSMKNNLNRITYYSHDKFFQVNFLGGCSIIDNWEENSIYIFNNLIDFQGKSNNIMDLIMENEPLLIIKDDEWTKHLNKIKEEYLFMSELTKEMLANEDTTFNSFCILFTSEIGGKNKIIKRFSDKGTKEINLPSDSAVTEIVLYDQAENEYTVDYKLFQKMEKMEYDVFTDEEKNKIPFLFDGDSISMDYPIEYSNEAIPEIHYSDYTEKHILQFNEFSQNEILNIDKGIWAYHGIRKIHFFVDKTVNDYKSIKSEFYFDTLNNATLETPISFDCVKVDNDDKYEFVVDIDTDVLGDKISQLAGEQLRNMFVGYLTLKFEYDAVGNSPVSEDYCFYIKMIVVNTELKDFDSDSSVININNAISVDFGTSSTCVAIDGDEDGTRLIRLTGKAEEEQSKEINTTLNVNIYENPTNLMICDWDLLCKQWLNNVGTHPLPHKHNGVSILDDDEHEYDFGYSVKAAISEADKRFLEAVITQLKIVPYDLAHKKQSFVVPFESGEINMLSLVDSPEKQDKEHFDPIAFYGYLLGRAVNNPQNGKMYTKYYVTYPVKFETEVRESIRKSLEYGIKMSLPKPVRNMEDEYGSPIFSVEMRYSEPVAYAGAICGKDKLSLIGDTAPKLFAVFDFGGGTLDYSFCMYRLADEEENDDGYESVLQVFGVDGDATLGGERLINQISYWIVSSDVNMEVINQPGEEIPFIKPEGELRIDGVENLFLDEKSASQVARANTRHLNERISRELFEAGSEQTGNGKETIVFYNSHNDEVQLELTIDYGMLNGLLQERIYKSVENFSKSMDNTFNLPNVKEILNKYDVDPNSVTIFLAGNASKHPIVMDCMKDIFNDADGSKIFMIDEKFQSEEYDDRYSGYRITPKTAVAIGQAKLISSYDCKVDTMEEPFAWYIAKQKMGDNLEHIIEKNTTDMSWRKVGPVKNGEIRVICSETVDFARKKPVILKCDRANDGKLCFIRPFDNNELEYIVLEKGESPEAFTGDSRTIVLN